MSSTCMAQFRIFFEPKDLSTSKIFKIQDFYMMNMK